MSFNRAIWQNAGLLIFFCVFFSVFFGFVFPEYPFFDMFDVGMITGILGTTFCLWWDKRMGNF